MYLKSFNKKKKIPVSTLLWICVTATGVLYNLPSMAGTLAGDWVQQALRAVSRNPKTTGPTVASRVYGILGTAMYDAWSAYEEIPISTLLEDNLQRPQIENTLANKEKAISFAAYRVLAELFTSPTDLDAFNSLMGSQGYEGADLSNNSLTPSGIGNTMAQQLMEFRRRDGSNQLGGYADTSGYIPINSPDAVIIDITRWTPEHIPIDNLSSPVQQYLTPHWSQVVPFALESADEFRPVAPEPFLLDPQATADLEAKTITRSDGTTVNITPDLIGTDINPVFITQAEEIFILNQNLRDEQKAIAEFWEDGGGTAFPAGHWMQIGLDISERDNNTLDEDVKLFFALGNGVFDAGIATWEAKGYYDYTRPVRAIRELARLGLIEESALNFTTYQTPGGNPSPPFAEYTSGHSAYSAAGAEILKLFTGSDFWGQGVTINDSLFFSGSFASPINLYWNTFTEAAEQSGISRRYGGIHFEQGDLNSRILGRQVGDVVWQRSQFFINGGVSVPEANAAKALLILSSLFLLARIVGSVAKN